MIHWGFKFKAKQECKDYTQTLGQTIVFVLAEKRQTENSSAIMLPPHKNAVYIHVIDTYCIHAACKSECDSNIF